MRAEFRNGLLKSSGESDLTDTLFARLEELGFVFCKKAQQIRLLRLAIKTYKSVYGDLNIPKVRQQNVLLILLILILPHGVIMMHKKKTPNKCLLPQIRALIKILHLLDFFHILLAASLQ